MNKRQAVAYVRDCANAQIEQLTRLDKGWDQGKYRDDDMTRIISVRQGMRMNVDEAFRIARQFAS